MAGGVILKRWSFCRCRRRGFDGDIYGEMKLVGVDIIRGSPVERLLSAEDLAWLKGVAFQSWFFEV